MGRPVMVEQERIRAELFREEDCAHLAGTQTIFPLGCVQTGRILNRLHLNPFRFRNLRCSGQAGASDDNFVVNFRGDINTWEKLIEAVKTDKLGQNNQRRSIYYDSY